MIFLTQPKEFKSKFEVVSCFLESDGEILLLRRQSHKSEGNKWGAPAGKVEKGETIDDAMTRELEQETGYRAQPGKLAYFNKIYVKFPDYDFIYHIYHLLTMERFGAIINPEEHTGFRWISPKEALEIHTELVQDMDACIKLFYKL